MASAPVPLLQTQLDATLRLLISLSSTMTVDELISVRVRLTEASIVLGHALVELERNNANADNHVEPAVTLQNINATEGNSGDTGPLDRVSVHHNIAGDPTANSTRRSAVRRTVTRAAARNIRSLARSQRARNASIPLIEMESDDN